MFTRYEPQTPSSHTYNRHVNYIYTSEKKKKQNKLNIIIIRKTSFFFLNAAALIYTHIPAILQPDPHTHTHTQTVFMLNLFQFNLITTMGLVPVKSFIQPYDIKTKTR